VGSGEWESDVRAEIERVAGSGDWESDGSEEVERAVGK